MKINYIKKEEVTKTVTIKDGTYYLKVKNFDNDDVFYKLTIMGEDCDYISLIDSYDEYKISAEKDYIKIPYSAEQYFTNNIGTKILKEDFDKKYNEILTKINNLL